MACKEAIHKIKKSQDVSNMHIYIEDREFELDNILWCEIQR